MKAWKLGAAIELRVSRSRQHSCNLEVRRRLLRQPPQPHPTADPAWWCGTWPQTLTPVRLTCLFTQWHLHIRTILSLVPSLIIVLHFVGMFVLSSNLPGLHLVFQFQLWGPCLVSWCLIFSLSYNLLLLLPSILLFWPFPLILREIPYNLWPVCQISTYFSTPRFVLLFFYVTHIEWERLITY